MSDDINKINKAVFDGIRKTINRFRENPFLYFTEADIHSSLSKDIMNGHSNLFIMGKKNRSKIKFPVSLLHHEYPTDFRFISEDLKQSGFKINLKMNKLDYKDEYGKGHGRRGHFDLIVLNPNFIKTEFSKGLGEEAMKQVVNKDYKNANVRNTKEEVLFAIEVKFIHEFNKKNKSMLKEVIKDDKKLNIAYNISGEYIMPINLIFCNTIYEKGKKASLIDSLKEYLDNNTSQGVCSVFIETHYKDKKKIALPIIFNNKSKEQWAKNLKKTLRVRD